MAAFKYDSLLWSKHKLIKSLKREFYEPSIKMDLEFYSEIFHISVKNINGYYGMFRVDISKCESVQEVRNKLRYKLMEVIEEYLVTDYVNLDDQECCCNHKD